MATRLYAIACLLLGLCGCATVSTESDVFQMRAICQPPVEDPSAPIIRTYGGTRGDGFTGGQSLAGDGYGGYVVAGVTQGLGAYAGNADLLLAHISGAGKIQWANTFGGPQMDIGTAFARSADAGHIQAGDSYGHLHTGMAYVVSGSDTQRLLLVKTDSGGNYQWHKLYLPRVNEDGRGSNMFSVLQSPDGGYAIIGSVAMNPIGPKGPKGLWSDVLLARTDSSGNALWARSYGDSGPDEAYSACQAGDGGYLLGGAYSTSGDRKAFDVLLLKVDGNGRQQWAKTLGGSGRNTARSIIRTQDGGYAIAADTDAFGMGGTDLLLIKTDETGVLEWAKTLGGTGEDIPFMLLQTSDGGYLVTGFTTSFGDGKGDAIIVKTDGFGELQWARTFGESGKDTAYSAIELASGAYAVTGETESYGSGKQDMFLLEIKDPGALGSCLRAVEPEQMTPTLQSADRVLAEGEIELLYQSDSLRKQTTAPLE